MKNHHEYRGRFKERWNSEIIFLHFQVGFKKKRSMGQRTPVGGSPNEQWKKNPVWLGYIGDDKLPNNQYNAK